MEKGRNNFAKTFSVFLITGLFFVTIANRAQTKKGDYNYNAGMNKSITQEDSTGKIGDVFAVNINNIYLPINSSGVLANVFVGDNLPVGYFDDNIFLFSSGFALGGKYENDEGKSKTWASVQFSSTRDKHFLPGIWETGENDPRAQIYVVRRSDPAFGKSWQDWKDAVALGADFYDGDGNGIYNPVDKNNNGKWDENEDMPDLLGDITVWTAYHDGVKPEDIHGFEEVPQMGIDIRQSIFGFDTEGKLGNVLFIRYKIENTGRVDDVLDSVYFGKATDPDLGDYENDLVGSDIALNAGFVYDRGNDNFYKNSPSFMTDILQGPPAFIAGETYIDNDGNGLYDEGTDTPLDTAVQIRGQQMGIEKIPGARNQPMSAFIHLISSHRTRGGWDNEEECYNYLKGRNSVGDTLDPCDNSSIPFSYYNAGAGCDKVNPFIWFTGDPVADTGWICDGQMDQTMITSSGPFTLKKGEPVEIVVGYIVGRGETSLQSVPEAKKIDRFTQMLFDNNFTSPAESPPVVEPTVNTTENSIELIWETDRHLNWTSSKMEAGEPVYDVRFEGYEVNMYRKDTTASVLNGVENKKTIARYDVENSIGDIVYENSSSEEREIVYPKGTQLDPVEYSDPTTGVIRLVIEKVPFTGEQLIKDKPYYISITSYGINRVGMEDLSKDKKLVKSSSLIGLKTTNTGIIGGDQGIVTGRDLLKPYRRGVAMEKTSGFSPAEVYYNIVDQESAQPHEYEVTFELDDSSPDIYRLFWKVTDVDENQVVLDSADMYEQARPMHLAEGIMPVIEWIEPGVDSVYLEDGAINYFRPVDEDSITGVHYMGKDLQNDTYPYAIDNYVEKSFSKFTRASDMRRVEIRFYEPGKAYRFVRPGIINNDRFVYPTTEISGGQGFVDVPFSAYIKDFRTGEERKVSVGYLETYPSSEDDLGYPDEKWNPYTDLEKSREYIIVFNSSYDPNGGNPVYTGTGSEQPFLTEGYELDTSDPAVTDSMAAIAASPWHDAFYVVGLEANDSTDNFNPSGKFVVEPRYPLTEMDKYRFTPQTELTKEEKKDLFDKVNVYPNPLMGYNPRTAASSGGVDNQFVTFINLPEEVTIKIFTLSGNFVRELTTADKSSPSSPTLQWNLKNKAGRKVASGMYLAIVESPGLGEKVLKLGILMPDEVNYQVPVD